MNRKKKNVVWQIPFRLLPDKYRFPKLEHAPKLASPFQLNGQNQPALVWKEYKHFTQQFYKRLRELELNFEIIHNKFAEYFWNKYPKLKDEKYSIERRWDEFRVQE
jgi:hypothetical protein